MLLKVLDTKQVNDNTWALCKGNLLEYLRGLKTNFFEFSVQRKIVNNVYLDNIYHSVEIGEPFPPVTLTYSGIIPSDTKGSIDIDENCVEILDGLQRTYRLWVILFFEKLIKESGARDLKSLAEAAKGTEEGEVILQNRFITPKFLRKLFEVENNKLYVEILLEHYEQFDVYFNIWTGLDDKAIIRKMLVLNAGQKSVSSTHQFELLFLNFFEENILDYNNAVTLIREKDKRYRDVLQGKRDLGEYLMSSVVIALQSFINGKQLRIQNKNLINLDDNKLLNDEKLATYFNAITLSEFINHLYNLGEVLSNKNPDYVKWYGKDTVLSGVFGAIGSNMIEKQGYADVQSIGQVIHEIEQNNDPFKLKEYYDAYENKLESSKVNVGNAVRKAIFNYTKELLSLGKSDWYIHFSQRYDYDEE